MISALIGWAILGLIAGAMGRLLVPGKQPLGLLKTMLLGIAGSYVGGFLNYLLRRGEWLEPTSWIMSTLGAAILLSAYVHHIRKQS